ncbi:hypothetical protein L7F22_004404 [Adiantum nelumboides]|nr:hypothetical protein [Adiantum nelumboides]
MIWKTGRQIIQKWMPPFVGNYSSKSGTGSPSIYSGTISCPSISGDCPSLCQVKRPTPLLAPSIWHPHLFPYSCKSYSSPCLSAIPPILAKKCWQISVAKKKLPSSYPSRTKCWLDLVDKFHCSQITALKDQLHHDKLLFFSVFSPQTSWTEQS